MFVPPPQPAAADGTRAAAAQPLSSPTPYDRYIEHWNTALARQFLKFAAIGAADRILDVGSGTGTLTAVIAAATGASQIIGIDPATDSVITAQKRVDDPRVTFDRGTADHLPYPDRAFDAVVAHLTFHDLPNKRRALHEMRRVTRPGGTIAACEWDTGPAADLSATLRDTLFQPHPPLAAQSAHPHTTTRGDLLSLWHSCGIADAQERPLVVPLTFPDFNDFWIPFTQAPSGIRDRLDALCPTLQAAYKTNLKSRLLKGKPHAPLTLATRAWAIHGLAP